MAVKQFCTDAIDHAPGETCPVCSLVPDEYGNTEADFLNCSFPDCGCDGARNCMAPNGPSGGACAINIERKGR